MERISGKCSVVSARGVTFPGPSAVFAPAGWCQDPPTHSSCRRKNWADVGLHRTESHGLPGGGCFSSRERGYCVWLLQACRLTPAHTVASPLAGKPYTRSTVITAVKFLISDQPHPIDPLLKSYIGMCPPVPVLAEASTLPPGLEFGRMSHK